MSDQHEHSFSGKCPTCERARGEEAGYARGYADAIARVVADLRARAPRVCYGVLMDAADRYERGEHEREGA